MTNTKQTQSTHTSIVLGAALGLALIAGIAVRVDDAAPASASGTATQSQAIAEWAGSQSLSGLSPVSLNVVSRSAPGQDVDLRFERAAIAEWAGSQGLSGLSPASLAPIAK